MTIRLKIVLGCLALTLMTAGVALYQFTVRQQLGTLATQLYDDAFQSVSYLRMAQNDLLVAATLPDEDATARIGDSLDNLEVGEQHAMSDGGRRATSALRDMLTQLRTERGETRTNDFAAAQEAFDTAVEIYAADGYHFRRIVGQVMVSTDRRVSIIIAVSMTAAFLISVFLIKSILPQVREAVGIAQSIAAGRLDTPIRPAGRSETAQLLRALATMQSAIALSLAENRALLAQQTADHAAQARHQTAVDGVVHAFGSSLAGVFRIVSGASVGMAGTAGGLVNDSQALLQGERDVHQEIEQVVARIDTASQSSRALNEAIFGIRTETAQTEQRARATLEETQAATDRMQTLGRAADEITSVADMIGALAAQTKLLSLNASIEAARAGEAGAGFAVVAGEVKRLADRSAEAAQIVSRRIASILEAAGATRTSIAAITVSTQDVHRQSASIAEAVAAQNAASSAMWDTISDILVNATNVKQSLGTIGGLTRHQASNLNGIAGEARTLSQNAADLSREVSAFLEFVGSTKPGELGQGNAMEAPARLELGGSAHTGQAIFSSELAVCFQPPVSAEIGATGMLYLLSLDCAIPVRVAQLDEAATQLQPPLANADRARVRAALDTLAGRSPAA